MANKTCKTTIGGQAVLEGVMMRGTSSMATAVRNPQGKIVVETKRINSKKSVASRIPLLRGIVNFVNMLIVGMQILLRSAEVYGDAEPSKFELTMARKFKINVINVIIIFSLILGIALAISLFILLPTYVVRWIQLWTGATFSAVAISLLEGFFKLLIFVLYLLFCSQMKDIKRVFMYHGAEHKTISCFEAGDELTVENVRKHSKIHDRCGTTFMFIVLFVSIIVSIFLPAPNSPFFPSDSTMLRIACKILFLPVVAGVSYEVLKILAKLDNWFVRIIKAPGLSLQLLTTKQPTDDMIEVAITAFTTVAAMEKDGTIEPVRFKLDKRMSLTRLEVERIARKVDKADIDWILVAATGLKRDELTATEFVTEEQYNKAVEYAEERAKGIPVQYVLGSTEFFGLKIKTDKRALIPRFETELVAEQAIKLVGAESKVLDLCTGSGAIALAVKANTNASVTASDISGDAIALAEENAASLQLDIEFVKGDMFENIFDRFDVIVSNPPYITDSDMTKLDGLVKDNEPTNALSGGADGLKFYRIIAENADKYLTKSGAVVLELGIGQAKAVADLFVNYQTEIIKDYDGIERILIAKVRNV